MFSYIHVPIELGKNALLHIFVVPSSRCVPDKRCICWPPGPLDAVLLQSNNGNKRQQGKASPTISSVSCISIRKIVDSLAWTEGLNTESQTFLPFPPLLHCNISHLLTKHNYNHYIKNGASELADCKPQCYTD